MKKMSQIVAPKHNENELQDAEICNNKLDVEIGVVKGSKGFSVAKVSCPRLPFYGDKVAEQMLSIVKNDPDELGREVVSRLESFVSSVSLMGLKVSSEPKIYTMDSSQTPRKVETYKEENWFNLFVDMGSTNAKWMITRCDKDGKHNKLDTIPRPQETSRLCADWGIRYDKSLAYTYKQDDFNDWLCSAVLIFVRHVQNDRQAYAFNVFWSFPKLHNVDFKGISDSVTMRLKEYGLKGKFVLVPEAEALESMFRDRILHIAMAAESEVRANLQEEKKAREHNSEEDEKVAQNKKQRENARNEYRREMRKYENMNWIQRARMWIRGEKPERESVPKYEPDYIEVVKDRRQKMKDFRKIGINSRKPFSMLFLDAGGSTLDYCFIPKGATACNAKVGSYLAGGRQVTEAIKDDLDLEDLEQAEERKLEFSRSVKNKTLRLATQKVYEECLSKLSKVVNGHGEHLCVVCTGLAMRNKCLRNLVREKLSLPKDQRMIWSEDLAELLPDEVGAKYPDLKDLKRIVSRLAKDGQASPAYDVIGGLYFYANAKEGGVL